MDKGIANFTEMIGIPAFWLKFVIFIDPKLSTIIGNVDFGFLVKYGIRYGKPDPEVNVN